MIQLPGVQILVPKHANANEAGARRWQQLAGVVGVALEARKFTQVTSIYGAVHGVRGIIEENFVDLTRETTHNLEQVADTPSSGLLSTRDKPDEEYCARMFKVMQAHDIRYFFYVGGNDSSDTVRIVNEQAKQANYELRAIHIPKTIDNDIIPIRQSLGAVTAAEQGAKFFSNVVTELGASARMLIVHEVMGRNCGWLTAATAEAYRRMLDAESFRLLPTGNQPLQFTLAKPPRYAMVCFEMRNISPELPPSIGVNGTLLPGVSLTMRLAIIT